jgi:hypothetical protein
MRLFRNWPRHRLTDAGPFLLRRRLCRTPFISQKRGRVKLECIQREWMLRNMIMECYIELPIHAQHLRIGKRYRAWLERR